MEEDSTNDVLSENDLRNAGASALFVAYYNEAPPLATARREVERGPFSLEELNESPELGGSFFAALWNGDYAKALGRADSDNTEILRNIKA